MTGLAVFDLDGVLTRRDLMTAVVTAALRRAPHRALVPLPAVANSMRLRNDPERRRAAAATVIGHAFAGWSPAELRELSVGIATRWVRERRFIREAAVEAFREHTRRGDEVVVATASNDDAARALVGALGLEPAAVVASAITVGAGRALIEPYNIGEQKLRSLTDAGVDVGTAVFYTDSASDLPTARGARRTVLVAPSATTVRRFDEAGVRYTLLDEVSTSTPGRVP
ncbi:HAD family hydrolase [Herbiconiux sp. KACC 21604]|uniref:HAD family hydrolase n=1 Tax=unclassified Herbiconiux TaxID=2618217 RepID=UPI001493276C|nr:HAD family hydrolase [Herbiconiux sp. SALV-R1]QJU55131.1 haloacid dehalogenase-like hydrolase [Herbiconiux sp. SALV-R1]WPO86281.1 HAD family hydrolase [Herbiconiux sp. KACC 21604]